MKTGQGAVPGRLILGERGAYAEVNETRIYYETHGAGHPLLLMHGGLETIESLHPQADALAQHYQVILPERRGHGRTPDIPGPLSYLQGARDMAALIRHLGILRPHLVGYSDGAIVALFMGIHFADMVGKIVSIAGNYHYSGLSKRFAGKMRAMTLDEFKRSERQSVQRYERTSPDGPGHLPVVFEKVKRLWLTQPRLTARDLARIAAPVLVIAADRDLISPSHTVNLFRFLPNARLCIVPGATHSLITEASEEVNRALLRFLRE
jgi:pimeloyl-ACP methyl ester carboxylesterase